MQLRRPRLRRRASITSLIDVIFLLLLFFMLSSSLSRFSEIEISVAEQRGNQSSELRATNQLLIEANGVSLGAEHVADDELVNRLILAVESGATDLTVVPGESIHTQRLVDVLTIVASVPALKISLVAPRS